MIKYRAKTKVEMGLNMRKNEIDWIRNIAILMLFPYHTAVIFDNMGSFFIKAQYTHQVATMFIASTFFWYMPLLFFLAGASTYHAFGKRSTKAYVKERCLKLLLPLIIGLLTVVPSQVYYALLWRGKYTGNIFEFYRNFLSRITDFTGTDGAFTPGHLWFILFLFIISILAIPIIKWINTQRGDKLINFAKSKFLNYKGLFLVYGIFMVAEIVPRLGNKSLAQNLLLFIFGYICYRDEEFINKIELKRRKSLVISIIGTAISTIVYVVISKILPPKMSLVILVICTNAIVIPAILAIIGYGRRFLTNKNWLLKNLNTHSFYIYILHQPILIACAYYILPLKISGYIKVMLILLISFVVTMAACFILRVVLQLFNIITDRIIGCLVKSHGV